MSGRRRTLLDQSNPSFSFGDLKFRSLSEIGWKEDSEVDLLMLGTRHHCWELIPVTETSFSCSRPR